MPKTTATAGRLWCKAVLSLASLTEGCALRIGALGCVGEAFSLLSDTCDKLFSSFQLTESKTMRCAAAGCGASWVASSERSFGLTLVAPDQGARKSLVDLLDAYMAVESMEEYLHEACGTRGQTSAQLVLGLGGGAGNLVWLHLNRHELGATGAVDFTSALGRSDGDTLPGHAIFGDAAAGGHYVIAATVHFRGMHYTVHGRRTVDGEFTVNDGPQRTSLESVTQEHAKSVSAVMLVRLPQQHTDSDDVRISGLPQEQNLCYLNAVGHALAFGFAWARRFGHL